MTDTHSTERLELERWWWRTLFTLKREYESSLHSFDSIATDFDWWLAANHGVGLNRDTDGDIMVEYTITDEKKHLVFLLKYR
jgi:hypothetical protein